LDRYLLLSYLSLGFLALLLLSCPVLGVDINRIMEGPQPSMLSSGPEQAICFLRTGCWTGRKAE